MAPHTYGSSTAPAIGWSATDGSSAAEIDGLLAGAGYHVRSSDLPLVAHNLERLDSADHLASASVHYNPTDLSAWVDSLLSDLSPPLILNPPPPHRHHQSHAWTEQIYPHHPPIVEPPPPPQPQTEEEDSGIRLVHLLMSCADAVQRGDSALAGGLIDEMRMVLVHVNTGFGIGKVAGHFLDALFRRLYSPACGGAGPEEAEILYHHFYEACPYLKFAHFTANQAILEAFDGHDRVHVVDFNLMHGLQWPALIQALALRPGGPPFLRVTGIGPPSSNGRDTLREVGIRLAELARSVHVRFAFRGVAAARLDDVRPWMLHVADGEAVAFNSVLQLHRLLGDPESPPAQPIDAVLGWVAGLKPKIVTVIEQEADHNKPDFLDRFTEALFYYSTMFDSLESTSRQQQQATAVAVAEVYLQRELSNVVCCEGEDRVERHEPLARWRARLSRAGLRPVHLGSNAFKQARMLLTLFSGEGYCVEEVDGCLTLGWHSRPLISASAWRAEEQAAAPPRDAAVLRGGNINIRNVTNTRIMRVNNNNSCSASNNSSSSSNSSQNIIAL